MDKHGFYSDFITNCAKWGWKRTTLVLITNTKNGSRYYEDVVGHLKPGDIPICVYVCVCVYEYSYCCYEIVIYIF